MTRGVPYLTVAASPAVRVYRSTTNYLEHRYYVCSQRTGRAYLVARTIRGGGAATTGFALDELAVVPSANSPTTYIGFRFAARGDINFDRFVVVDHRGRRVHDTGRLALPGEFSDNDRTALVLTPSGSFAYQHLGLLRAVDAAGTRVLATPAAEWSTTWPAPARPSTGRRADSRAPRRSDERRRGRERLQGLARASAGSTKREGAGGSDPSLS